ncbi:MerR family transcriptional regulator [Streptomyces sp. RKND-216]|uniref:MerR family transcriptional regulator n=1 Tax=Streptomyces sp. RKND-216 TaxID=2562581 RepID=UPI00109E1716|nr:MerR family transcriptional regulator [Streptomyces sp. RKND-216]THA24394.1 MerR family transcriptional regulator [Streptomyces sp. RKND-216]
MFSIGDFARHGRVSVRMLRHYDAVGLLRPAHVDPSSGYRSYEAVQLARLNRVIALKELGFTLDQVQKILDEKVTTEELRGMLRLRRAELAAARRTADAQLAQVEARLRTIESEGTMSTHDVVVKSVPAVRVAELSAVAGGFEPEHIGPVVGPLFENLCCRLDEAGVRPTGPGLAYYEDAPEGADGSIVVHAAMPVASDAAVGHGVDLVVLPAVESAATIVHRGPMDGVLGTLQTLAHWIDDNGYTSGGYNRELYLECPADRADWVTELQEPVTRV